MTTTTTTTTTSSATSSMNKMNRSKNFDDVADVVLISRLASRVVVPRSRVATSRPVVSQLSTSSEQDEHRSATSTIMTVINKINGAKPKILILIMHLPEPEAEHEHPEILK